VLLFFAISVTDDLHAEQAPMEESSRLTLKVWKATQGCLQAGKHTARLTFAVSGDLSNASTLVVGKVAPSEIHLLRLVLVRPSEGRSPPSLHS